jgi:hypothetical protein
MNPSTFPSRSTQFSNVLIISLMLSLPGCGGGGGETLPASDPLRIGAGWITITGSSAGTDNATSLSSVILSGDAFISPTWWSCCTGTATDTGVTVSWVNTTTGVSGAAWQSPKYCWLLGTFLCGNEWEATVDLVLGNNTITVTATDPSGNLGRAMATVTRTADLTPPVIQATSPANAAIEVATNSVVTVRFNEAMDPSSISAATILLRDDSNNFVSGSVTYLNRVSTFTPVGGLRQSSNYTATVTTGVHDIAGNALATAYIWSFSTTTLADTTPQ